MRRALDEARKRGTQRGPAQVRDHSLKATRDSGLTVSVHSVEGRSAIATTFAS
jgi:hypothetical protein